MRYFVIAGEASGDLHASNLIKAIKKEDPTASFEGWGGDLMIAASCNINKHYRDLAFMGFYEVAKNIGTILNNFKICKQEIQDNQPDVLILVDYPGFNLRIAKWAKKQGIKVFYYISPQIWAWHESRVHGIKETVDKMFVILPFEKDFYTKYNYEVDFVGHPLLDCINNFQADTDFKSKHNLSDKPIIALLPGSRKQEITSMLSVMLSVIPHYPDYQFVIGGAPSMPIDFYNTILDANDLPLGLRPQVVNNDTYNLLSYAQVALVTSGTATLETALFEVPQIVCYTGNPVSYFLAKRFIQVKYISLVNLILDRILVKELIQKEFSTTQLQQELNCLLDEKYSKQILKGYQELKEQLGSSGASNRAAKLMVGYLK